MAFNQRMPTTLLRARPASDIQPCNVWPLSAVGSRTKQFNCPTMLGLVKYPATTQSTLEWTPAPLYPIAITVWRMGVQLSKDSSQYL